MKETLIAIRAVVVSMAVNVVLAVIKVVGAVLGILLALELIAWWLG